MKSVLICVNPWLKNEKVCSFSEKIAKSHTTFRKNKPNFKTIKISASPFKTSKYEILSAWRGKKQTQFKANSNSIPERPKMHANAFSQKDYKDFAPPKGQKTNPKQTQYKFILKCRSRGANTSLSSNVAVGGPISVSLAHFIVYNCRQILKI